MMIPRIVDVWRVVRPRALSQTRQKVEDLGVDLARLRDEMAKMAGLLDEIHTNVAALGVRESQLRAVMRRDAELASDEAALSSLLCTPQIRDHVERRFAESVLCHNPLPHLVVDRILPDAVYEALVAGIPPVELFHERRPNKRQMTVPFTIAPSYGRRVWDYFAQTIVPMMFVPGMVDKFREPLVEWLQRSFPALGASAIRQMKITASDGRILLRTRGYLIPPHRDPKWGFLTGLMYLARPGDDEAWGTQLYAVEGDEEARGVAPHWIDPARCRRVADVSFIPNRMLVFLNAAGAHGATIPEDAQPESLERYAYQFRVGPGGEGMKRALETLPAERRPFWAGRGTGY
jgi:hypothetical protein